MNCCGAGEIHGLMGNPKLFMRELLPRMHRYDGEQFNGIYLMYSDINTCQRGETLTKYILENKLGDIATLPPQTNPNSGNLLKVWLWSIDFKVLDAWKEKDDKEVGKNSGGCDCPLCKAGDN